MTPSQKLLKNIVALIFKVPRNWKQKENLEMCSWCSLPLVKLFWCPACFFFFLFKDFLKCGPFFFQSYWISYNVAPVLCFFGPQGMWEFSPWAGIEPMSLALEGKVPATGPPGKSQASFWGHLFCAMDCLFIWLAVHPTKKEKTCL